MWITLISSSLPWRPYDKTLKDLGSGLSHTIPLLARSRITRHSGAQPPLPGRLPLGNPIGNVLPDEPQRPPAHWSFVPTHNPKPSLGCVSGSHLNKRRRAEAETTGGYTRRDVLLWDASATNPSHSPQQGELNFTTMDTGSTIKPNVLAHGSPKPFPAAAREPVSHSPGKEIPGSWNLAGVDINALAQDQGHHESFGGFDFADPEDPNIDWSAFQPPGNADIGG
ncbi:hypothetical protein F5Y18DRAFT_225320 [Xylariaceae sp. FL1019]|nr:hypothetical protein F5Y18DRAFT_225320 [Xylariaceae sp. FL1019]